MRSDPKTLDPSKQARARKEEQMREAREVLDMRAVMVTVEGRRVLYRVIELCGAGVIADDPTAVTRGSGETDIPQTMQRVGQVSIGDTIKREILMLVPDLYVQMMTEAAQDAATDIKTRALQEATEITDELDDETDG